MSIAEEDLNLIEAFKNGDETSFNRLILKYQQKIYWLAHRMTGNHFDADEVVQEVLMVMYKKIRGFEFRSSLYTWIYKITLTRSINFINRRKVRENFSIDENSLINLKSEDSITDNIEAKEKLNKLDKVLQLLPVKQREIFVLRNFNEMSYKEISDITGKSVGGLKANYFHAYKRIVELMEEGNDG
ncbi:MAG TPA: RNA polymerase sigma factor [Ignavibacteria bacterium]|nr:RNA polymerase sigma factor [Ignavibacteria bacterium]